MAREDFYEDAQIIDYISQSDGLGGVNWVQVPGAMIRAGFITNGSSEAVIAGRVGNKAIFTIQTGIGVELERDDVVLRLRDGRMYRVTGNAVDMTTPDVALDQYREVSAEVIT